MENFDAEFNDIVDQLNMDDFSDPRPDQISLWEVNRAIAGMNEASAYLGKFMGEVLKENLGIFPAEIAPMLEDLVKITDKISEVLSVCACPDCQVVDEECPNCAESAEGICSECLAYIEDLENGDE